MTKLRNAGYTGRCRVSAYAVMMELADMQDLGSCAARRVGSSPTNRISAYGEYAMKACWKKLKNVYLLSFLIPFLGVAGICIARGMFPFGENSFMYSDMYHQYIPFLTEFRRRLHSGESLLFSWRAGLGSDFLTIYAYYLASPENWLVYFIPEKYLIEFMTFFIVLKIGLCGLTFAHYLRSRFHTEDLRIVWFSVFYALSAYTAAYSWNHMWMNCLWLAPLVILGLEGLVKEGRWRLYCLTLTLCILTNYYLSIPLCIFLCLYFLMQLFTNGLSLKKKGVALLRFTGASLLAGSMCAVLLFPVGRAMLATDFGSARFPDKAEAYFNVLEMLVRHVPMLQVERGLEHWPNIYCGVLVFVLVPIYFLHKKISLKEKAGRFLLLGIFLASFSINILNFIWHGFNYPNSLPARQSFLYIFLVLTMCFEAVYRDGENGWINRLIGVVCGAVLLAACGIFVTTSGVTVEVMACAWIFLAGYFLLWLLCVVPVRKRDGEEKRWKPARYGKWAILGLAVVEAVMNMAVTGIPAVQRTNYLNNAAALKTLLAVKDAKEDAGDEAFYRVDSLRQITKNDGMLAGYASASVFASTVSGGVEDYYDALGMGGNKVSYFYRGATPLTAAMLGIRYTFSWQEERDTQIYELVGQQGEKYLYRNRYTLPVGILLFGEEARALEERVEKSQGNGIGLQNLLARELCGKTLFNMLDGREFYSTENGIRVETLEDGHLYAAVPDAPEDTVTLERNGEEKELENVDGKTLVDLGWYGAGESFSITAAEEDSFSMRIYRMNSQVLEEAVDKLGEVPFVTEQVRSDGLSGRVQARTGDLLVLSVPWDENWTVLVDGVETEPEAFCGAFLAVSLREGEHTVEIRYAPWGLREGAALSICSVLLFGILCRKRRGKQDSV